MRFVRPDRLLARRPLLRSLLGTGIVPLLLLSGCGSADPTYYTLTPWPGTVRLGGPSVVEVRTPSIAPFLDRNSIVRSDRNYRLTVASGDAWASDLSDMIGRTLSLDLGQRLPRSTVYTQAGAISTAPRALVEMDVSRFLEDASGQAEIEATLAISRPDGGSASGRVLHFTRRPANASMGALVAALSALLGQVADVAANALLALPPAQRSASLE